MREERGDTVSIIEEGRRVLDIEAKAIEQTRARLDGAFEEAVHMILACKGKVVVTGMGKSGIIARKIASTFSSTGTPAVFLHPAESSHGDLGIISANDLVIAISYGGASQELASVINFAARKDLPLIAMTAHQASPLGKASKVLLDISVDKEACPMGLAPTASSTVTLALGDALAMAVLKEKGFNRDDYAEFHPGGKLGRKLLTRVADLMHAGDALPLVKADDDMSTVISLMTSKEVQGVVGVVDDSGSLIGVVTEGDIRRRLERDKGPLVELARELMSRNPKTIDCNELAEKALFVMEQFAIQKIFAIDNSAKNPLAPVGLIHIHDLLKANIR